MFFYSKNIERAENKTIETDNFIIKRNLNEELDLEDFSSFPIVSSDACSLVYLYKISCNYNSLFPKKICERQKEVLEDLFNYLTKGTEELIKIVKSEVSSKKGKIPKDIRIRILNSTIHNIKLCRKKLYYEEHKRRSITTQLIEEEMYNPSYTELKKRIISELEELNKKEGKDMVPLNEEDIQKIKILTRCKMSKAELVVVKEQEDITPEGKIERKKIVTPDVNYQKEKIRRETTLDTINNLIDAENILRLLLYIETGDVDLLKKN